MSEITLYTIACEMLRETNPYNKDVSEIKCTIDDEQKNLLEIIEEELSSASYRGGARNYSKNNLLIAGNIISMSMEKYIENFNATFAYRQNVKEKLRMWLISIKERYNLQIEIPDALKIHENERDTGIFMVKQLHSREGVTKADLYKALQLTGEYNRSIPKNLRKLSPDLYEGASMGSEYEPFRIGGQPLRVKIKMREGENKTRYYWTPNTLHPIVLQENLLQVETLLKALSLSNEQYKSEISTFIALDIWSQLSEYAKNKIRERFEFEDRIHQEFLVVLDEYDFPQEYVGYYQTQREMLDIIECTIFDILRDAEKLPNRKYSIKYKDESGQIQHLRNVKIKRLNQLDYLAVNADGREYLFREEWLRNITVEQTKATKG